MSTEDNELKLIKARESLRREISSDENMINHYIKQKAKLLLDDVAKCKVKEERVVIPEYLHENITRFLRDLHISDYSNMHEYVGQYIISKKTKEEILRTLI